MYKALKEPLDMLFAGLANILGWGKDRIVDMKDESVGQEVIRYG